MQGQQRSPTPQTITGIVEKLREASAAYYNTGEPLMDDDTYDALLETLRELDPSNPFLDEVGAPPAAEGSVAKLPFQMPSLDKIKPGQDVLKRFLAAPGGFVLSDKLDGLSALWIPAERRLYLRGDGVEGQDISHLPPLGIQGLRAGHATHAIRGELILPRSEGQALARSWVNGVIHRNDPSASDVAKLRFLAYEVLSPPKMPRREQFAWLQKQGYEVPWNQEVPSGRLTEDLLASILKERRSTAAYELDGVVVGLAGVPSSNPFAEEDRARNPKDCVAFKMPLAEQAAETTVKEVIWNASAQGYLIPKLQFDPVTIGSATIQFCTAHNAKTVEEKGLGPGARIIIRRSGDVIPKLDAVLVPAATPSFPSDPNSYEWDATHTHIRLKAEDDSAAAAGAKLAHFLKTLEIPGAGPATATALLEAGITGPLKLWNASTESLSKVLGPKTGASLWSNYRSALYKASEKALMIASSQLPRGVGDTKLKALFEIDADPRGWREKVHEPPAGWTAASLETFWPALEAYLRWRAAELPFLSAKQSTPQSPKPASSTIAVANQGTLCCTGFRDKDLEQKAAAKGFAVTASMTNKVTILLVADGALSAGAKESEKVKAARAKGVKILEKSAFVRTYLS